MSKKFKCPECGREVFTRMAHYTEEFEIEIKNEGSTEDNLLSSNIGEVDEKFSCENCGKRLKEGDIIKQLPRKK